MRRSVVLVAVLLAVTMLVAPASTYTTAGLDRGTSVDVAADDRAVISADVPSQPSDKAGGRLVTVTNGFDRRVTFSVALRSGQQRYNIFVNGTSGSVETDGQDRVVVTLLSGESARVDYEETGGGPPGGSIRFAVTASGAGVTGEIVRDRPIQQGGGPPA